MLFARRKIFVSFKPQTEVEQETGGLFLVRAKDKTGKRAYYFMLVAQEKLIALKEIAKKKAAFDLKNYGEVVASGYGESVPESLRIRMRVEHGMAN